MRRLLAPALGLVALCVASVAYADPVVVVRTRNTTEGIIVVITDQNGAAHRCTTDTTGSCTLRGVAAGNVFVESHRPGGPPAGRHVIIPPDGEVSLIVPDA